MLVDTFEILVVVEQGDGRFLSNFGNTGDIVRGVAKQGLEIGLL